MQALAGNPVLIRACPYAAMPHFMRAALRLTLLLSMPLGGCGVDNAASLITGLDCSAAHLERQRPYCTPLPPSGDPAFCTKTLGGPQCWSNPEAFVVLPRELADPPYRNVTSRP